MLDTTRLITVDEFEQVLTASQNRLLELIHGTIVEKMPTEEHGIIAGNIHALLWHYVKTHQLGRTAIEVRHRVPGDVYNDRLPDICFHRASDRPVVTQGSVPTMPDLAVEIKSPTDTYTLMREKAQYYLQNGSQMVWLVYPEKKLVEVYRQNADVDILTLEDTLNGGEIISGFQLPLTQVFDLS